MGNKRLRSIYGLEVGGQFHYIGRSADPVGRVEQHRAAGRDSNGGSVFADFGDQVEVWILESGIPDEGTACDRERRLSVAAFLAGEPLRNAEAREKITSTAHRPLCEDWSSTKATAVRMSDFFAGTTGCSLLEKQLRQLGAELPALRDDNKRLRAQVVAKRQAHELATKEYARVVNEIVSAHEMVVRIAADAAEALRRFQKAVGGGGLVPKPTQFVRNVADAQIAHVERGVA